MAGNLDQRSILEVMQEANDLYESSVFEGSRGYFWGRNEKYYINLDGTIEESDGESPPQLGSVPKFVAEEMIRLASFEREHRELFSFACHVLDALGIDGEQPNAGNLALEKIRALMAESAMVTDDRNSEE